MSASIANSKALSLVSPILPLLLLTAAFYVLPSLIHRIVQSLDTTQELLGRRSRSPYAPDPSWSTAGFAVLVVLAWHVWISRLSFRVVGDDGNGKGGDHPREVGVTWGRVLGRIIIPGLLIVFGVGFIVNVFRGLIA